MGEQLVPFCGDVDFAQGRVAGGPDLGMYPGKKSCEMYPAGVSGIRDCEIIEFGNRQQFVSLNASANRTYGKRLL
jgi:hypothetical protein